MKPNKNKIHGAISEVKTARSTVKSFVSDAFVGEIKAVKDDVLSELSDLFDSLESFLKYLLKTDLAAEWRKEDV